MIPRSIFDLKHITILKTSYILTFKDVCTIHHLGQYCLQKTTNDPTSDPNAK